MNIFDLSIEELDKKMKQILSETTPKELLNDLIECGYKPRQIHELEKEMENTNYTVEKVYNSINDEYLSYLNLHIKRTNNINNKYRLDLEAA